MQLALDEVARRGERLRVLLPLNGGIPEPAPVGLAVVWCRENRTAYFGRFTCGAAYDPAVQPEARRVLHHHRGRAAA